jgi:hypothetical protein
MIDSVKAVMVRLILLRTALWVLMLLYLLGAIFSHSIPVSIKLEGPFGFAGWIALGVVVVLVIQHSGTKAPPVGFINPWGWILGLAFVAAAGLAVYFALTGNVHPYCPQLATSCLKFDHWKMSGGHFYRQYPFDSQGNDDPGAPWVEISRPEYVAEVGTRVRELMPFGAIALCIAYVLSRISIQPPGKWDKLPDPGPKLENLVLSVRSSNLRPG